MDKGAHFHRCDFQVHSPRDANWQGTRPTTEPEWDLYADELIGACRAIGLESIAITDHHDLCFAPFARRAAQKEVDAHPDLQKVVVFPGMELTLAVPCQAILILDADIPDDRLPLVGEAFAIDAVPLDQPLSSTVQRLELHTLGAVYEELDKREWLRGRYIVLPNVSEGGGSTLLRTGMAVKYVEMPCVGGYVDGLVTQFGLGNARIVAGEDVAYGNRAIAVFQSSDNRKRDHVDLGTSSTWVKWAMPSAEALRQACLARETRVSQDVPALPASYVSEILVSNSQFLGPVTLEMNQQYNAVIGGRGTGKSTLLEYLRWALCDQPPTVAVDDDLTDPASKRRQLVTNTLSQIPDALVEVRFVVNDLPHVVRRNADNGEVHLKVGDEDFRQVSEADVRGVIPIQAYSQKQLSSVAVRVEELTRFVTAPVQRELSALEDQVRSTESTIREAYARLQRQRQLQAAVRREELEVQSLTDQASRLRQGLTGITDDDQRLFEEKPRYDAARQFVDAIERARTRGREELAGTIEFIQRVLEDASANPDPAAPGRDELLAIRDSLRDTLATTIQALTESAAGLESLTANGATFSTASAAWLATATEFETRYEAARGRTSEHEQRLAELARVEERQRRRTTELSQTRDVLRDLGSPQDDYQRLRQQWLALWRDHRTAIATQCAALTRLSDGVIEASVEVGSALPELADALRTATPRSNVRGTRYDTLVENLSRRDDPLAVWEEVLNELEALALHGGDEIAGAVPDTPVLLSLGFPRADVERIASRITSDSWLDLSLAAGTDRPVFNYRVREGSSIPFRNASAGQQATALIQVLLKQGGPPLIVDQPEDDLDNEVILTVAEQVGRAKAARQVIFSSHNANLVVNGDADLVVGFAYRIAGDHSAGRIRVEGAIDVPEVRDVITSVMEGGERAFKLRRAKYGF